jgi:hypothetical protein
VLANKEENRRADVERLRAAGVPAWVIVIRTLDEALASLRRMFTAALGWPPDWLARADQAWAQPAGPARLRAVMPVWRDPWMVVGSATFTGDIARLGLQNIYGDHPERYPHIDMRDLAARKPDIVVLPRRTLSVQHGRRAGDVPSPAGSAGRRPQPHLVRTLARHRPGRACRTICGCRAHHTGRS